MKKITLLSLIVAILFSCGKTSDKENDSELTQTNRVKKSEEKLPEVDALEKLLKISGVDPMEQMEKLLEKDTGKVLPEMSAIENLLKAGLDSKKTGDNSALQDLFTEDALLGMLEKSGISRKDMEKLMNNPDSLKILAQKAKTERESDKLKKENTKGKISKEQLASKNTPTGVSLEEAILIVQAKSGKETTMATLREIDSLTGTKLMEQLGIEEAKRMMEDVERRDKIQSARFR